MPLQHVFAADGDYFSDFLKEHSENICFSLHTADFTEAEYGICRSAEYTEMQETEEKAHMRAESLCQAAARQKQKIAEMLLPGCNKARLAHAVLRFSEACLPPKGGTSAEGKILFHRMLSGCTEWGVHTVYAPFAAPSCTRILLHDPFGCFAPALLDGMTAACTACGYSVCLYRCALRSTAEHLTVPSLSLAVCTENTAHPFPFGALAVRRTEDFFNPTVGELPSVRLWHCMQTAGTLLEESAFSLYEAAQARRAQEKILEKCTDGKRFLLAQDLLFEKFFSIG